MVLWLSKPHLIGFFCWQLILSCEWIIMDLLLVVTRKAGVWNLSHKIPQKIGIFAEPPRKTPRRLPAQPCFDEMCQIPTALNALQPFCLSLRVPAPSLKHTNFIQKQCFMMPVTLVPKWEEFPQKTTKKGVDGLMVVVIPQEIY